MDIRFVILFGYLRTQLTKQIQLEEGVEKKLEGGGGNGDLFTFSYVP